MMLFAETLHSGYGQHFEVDRVLYRKKTEHQDLVIFETPFFGKVLALDGVIQTTERDNHVYHEMLAHVPILAHGSAREVLIVGGGDGGCLREVVKHPVERATLVDIDGEVIELSKRYLPELSDGAFDDPKAEVIIADGLAYLTGTDRQFDVIIVDSTDPIGPGEVLFSEGFYAACRRRLTPGGVVVTQNGVPLLQPDELRGSHRRLSALFADARFYLAAVPTYVGGAMALGWASDNADLHRLSAADIRPRYEAVGLKTRYYSPEVHAASFALPPEILALCA
jgi:spermidine synthase